MKWTSFFYLCILHSLEKDFSKSFGKKGQNRESKCELERLLGELGRTELRNACFLHTLLRKLVAESVHNGAFILPPQL